MSNSTLTCVYTVTPIGAQSVSSLTSRLAAVPVDLSLPHLWGLRYASDVTLATDGVAQRTIVFKMTPIVPANASAVLDSGSIGVPVKEVNLTGEPAGGSGYVAPAVISITGGAASNGEPAYQQAYASCVMQLSNVDIIKAGTGYQDGDVIVFSGGGWGTSVVAPSAEVSSINVSGGITGISIVTAGSGLTQPPDYSITTAGGSGAILSPGLGILSIDLVDAGKGFTTAPNVNITTSYLAAWPDTSDQASTLANFMTQIFKAALNTEVTAAAVVVS